MGELALLWHRRGEPDGQAAFRGLLAAMKEERTSPLYFPGMAMAGCGVAHEDEAGTAVLLLDGRLDNRRELERELKATASEHSDAELALSALRRWDTDGFNRLVGPFAIAFFDTRRRRLLLARDPLGMRSLFHTRAGGSLAAASEIRTLFAHPALSREVYEPALLGYFAAGHPPPGKTFYQDVEEVEPGCWIETTMRGTTARRFWKPTPRTTLRYSGDEEYTEHFRETLTTAVACRLPGTEPVGVLMSGGMDSTSVAAVAARTVEPGTLTALSWIFDSTPGGDERQWIDPTVSRLGLRKVWIRGDDAWPLQAERAPRTARASPYQHAYPLLLDRAYRAARQRGIGVLLTGDFGDHLYFGAARWLAHFLAAGRFAEALRGLRAELRVENGFRSARSALARAFRWPGRPARQRWLQPEVEARWRRERESWASGPEPGSAWEQALDPGGTRAALQESSWAARAGLEIRRPYRDLRLVELALSLPAHQLYRPGWLKWVLRKAMYPLLPESVRLRRQGTSLMPLFARGLATRERSRAQDLLVDGARLWPRYVRRDWVHSVFPRRVEANEDGPEMAVLWRCLCAEQWMRKIEGGDVSDDE